MITIPKHLTTLTNYETLMSIRRDFVIVVRFIDCYVCDTTKKYAKFNVLFKFYLSKIENQHQKNTRIERRDIRGGYIFKYLSISCLFQINFKSIIVGILTTITQSSITALTPIEPHMKKWLSTAVMVRTWMKMTVIMR
jgi:hypothetical protein